MRRTSFVAAALALVLAGGVALAGPKAGKTGAAPKEYIQWTVDWDQAKAEAAERNVPIVFAWHKDH